MRNLWLLCMAVLCLSGCQTQGKEVDPFDESALKIIRSITMMDSSGSTIEQSKIEFVYSSTNQLTEIIIPETLSSINSIKYSYHADSISVDLGQGSSVVNYAKFNSDYNITETVLSMEVMSSGESIVRDYNYNTSNQLSSVEMTSKSWAGDLEQVESYDAQFTWQGEELTAYTVPNIYGGSNTIAERRTLSYGEQSTGNSTNAYLLNLLLLPTATIDDVSFMLLPGFYFLPVSYNLIDTITIVSYETGEPVAETNTVKYGYNTEGYITTMSFGTTTLMIEY